MRCKIFFEKVFVFFCLQGILLSCSSLSSEIPKDLMRQGDLVFREGRSLSSAAIGALGGESGTYTHVGIVCIIGGDTLIVHAVPGEKSFPGDVDRVRTCTPEEFSSGRRALSVTYCHVLSDPGTDVGAAAGYAAASVRDSVLFDTGFDLYDDSRLYCTELVRNAYICAGLDISQGCIRLLPSLGRDVLLPSDLFDSPYLKPYCTIINK